MSPRANTRQGRRTSAFALVDVLLAVTIFALSVTGLVVTMQKIQENSNSYARDRQIQYGLEAAIAEAKLRPVEEVNVETRDEALQVTYATLAEPLELSNVDGKALADLYKVTVTATFLDAGGEQREKAEVYLYKPAQQNENGNNNGNR